MARCYPTELTSQILRDPKRSAEIEMFNKLCLVLGDKWVIFYSVAWIGRIRTNGTLHDGETDFIVAHPQHGVLLIEVKGGRIAYDGDRCQWTTTDRDDNIHDIRPFAQARKCKYDLRDKLHSLPGWGNQDIQLGYAVAFPNAVVNYSTALPPEAPADIIIDARDMSQLAERLEQIMSYWRTQDTTTNNFSGAQLIVALIRLLAPTTTLPNPLSVQITDEDREILRLTAEQYRLLDFLSRTRRAAIAGAAGSGKTMMAVEKAKRLAREGFRVLLTCYSSPLGTHLVRASADIIAEVGADQFFVGTFHGWCAHVATAAQLSLPALNGTPLWDQYPELLMKGLERRPDLKVDAVLVDEGQDMEELWWVALEASLSSHADSVFYVFYDDNQKVKKGASIPSDLGVQYFQLRENVRNTRAIHKLAAGFYQGNAPSEPRGPSGRTIEQIAYTDSKGLRKELSRLLHRLLNVESVPVSQIVVLIPRPLGNSEIPQILAELGTQQKLIQVSSIDMFKGLEQPVVIVTELDDHFIELPESERNALSYVAFSRPRSHLALLGFSSVLATLAERAIK